MREHSAEILSKSCLQDGPREQFLQGHGCALNDLVQPAFPLLPITASIPRALKDGLREVVVALGMPEPCEFLSLDRSSPGFKESHHR